MASFAFTYAYYHKIIEPVDFYNDEYGGIIKVLNFDAIRTIQFRLFIPFLYKALTFLLPLPGKAVFFIMTFGFTYMIFLVYFRLLCVYFTNFIFNALAALLVIYPMLWNLISVNNLFFFMDVSSVFFMTLCLYLIITKKPGWLLPVFLLGVMNHYSICFIVPAFLLFNRKQLFRPKTVYYFSGLVLIVVAYFGITRMLLPELPAYRDDGFFKWDFERTWRIILHEPRHLMIRDLFFNLGGLYIFAIFCFFSPVWNKIKGEYTEIFFVNFIHVAFIFLGFGIYIEELRCYVSMIPFIIIPAMLFFSQYCGSLLKIDHVVLKENTEASPGIITEKLAYSFWHVIDYWETNFANRKNKKPQDISLKA
jgi:hypothetical protein